MKETGDYALLKSDEYHGVEEQQVAKLKRFLEGWRMAVLPLKSVFLWEQQWHPCAIVGSVSLVFFTLWLLDLNTIAAFAVSGLIINFIDFIGPIICNTLYSPNSWTGQKEKMYEDTCRHLVSYYNEVLRSIRAYYSLREKSPLVYYVISISTLCFLAWISSAVNNILLLYIMSTTILLWPGIEHKGIFNNIFSMFYKKTKTS